MKKTMKLRITPLNLISAAALVLLILTLLQGTPVQQLGRIVMSPLLKILLGCLVLVSLITDLIFRTIFQSLKRVWIIELVFIALTLVFFLILKTYL